MLDASFTIGRTLRLFLVNGYSSGLITAELGNWTGKALVAPRADMPQLIGRPEVEETGVYLLIGENQSHPGRNEVYVGESDCVKNRLLLHDKDDDKQFFTRLCVVISKDENLTKSHVRYLEGRIIEQIDKAGRVKLNNRTRPDFSGLLPEPDRADMDRFLENLAIMLPVLDFDVLGMRILVKESEDSDKREDPWFELDAAGTKARGKEIGGEFIVLEGSLARRKETKSLSETTKLRRRQLRAYGILVPYEQDELLYRLTRNVVFSSPSAAADFVVGASMSGPASWKVEDDGATYKEWREKKLNAANKSASQD